MYRTPATGRFDVQVGVTWLHIHASRAIPRRPCLSPLAAPSRERRGAAAGGVSRCAFSLYRMVHYSRHAGVADDAALLLARRAHRWYFDPGEDEQLRAALPDMDWQRAGGAGSEWSLAHGDFEALLYSFSHREADPAFAGVWHSGLLDDKLADRSWKEVQKGMFPGDWAPAQLGTMMERLRAAAASPVVDPAALVVYEGATGRMLNGHAATGVGQSDAERAAANATAGVEAGEHGAPYDRPPWLAHVNLADGCLADGTSLAPAVDWAYYSLTRAAAEDTLIGSAFASFAEEAYEAALAHAVSAGGVRSRLEHRPGRVLAAMVARHAKAASWPPLLFIYSKPGVARELDLDDRHAYHACGGEGPIAQGIVLRRLSRVVEELDQLREVHRGARTDEALAREQRRLQGLLGVEDASMVLLRTLVEADRLLSGLVHELASPEVQHKPHADRVTHVGTLVAGGRLASVAGGGVGVGGGYGGGGSLDSAATARGMSSRLHAGRLAETMQSPAYIDTIRDARAYAAGELPAKALRILLGGRPASSPSVSASGAHVPGRVAHPPLVLAHMLLVARKPPEIHLIDSDLAFVERLRDRLPRFLGEAVSTAMGVTHYLALRPLAEAFGASEGWRTSPLDVFNGAWVPALRAEHGAAPIGPVALDAIYRDPYQVRTLAVRFLAARPSRAPVPPLGLRAHAAPTVRSAHERPAHSASPAVALSRS